MNDFRAFGLENAPHYIDGCVVSIKQTGGRYDSYAIGESMAHLDAEVDPWQS